MIFWKCCFSRQEDKSTIYATPIEKFEDKQSNRGTAWRNSSSNFLVWRGPEKRQPLQRHILRFPQQKHKAAECEDALGGFGEIGSGGRIRTYDLRVMSPTSCHCSTPRRGRTPGPPCSPGMAHGPCLPAVPRPVPSALRCFTARFGMGRGGSIALFTRHWFRVVQIVATFHLAPPTPRRS